MKELKGTYANRIIHIEATGTSDEIIEAVKNLRENRYTSANYPLYNGIVKNVAYYTRPLSNYELRVLTREKKPSLFARFLIRLGL